MHLWKDKKKLMLLMLVILLLIELKLPMYLLLDMPHQKEMDQANKDPHCSQRLERFCRKLPENYFPGNIKIREGEVNKN